MLGAFIRREFHRAAPMLFLFNDIVFDLGDPSEYAFSAGSPLTDIQLKKLTVGKAAKLVREAIHHDPDLARSRPDRAAFLSSLMAWKTNEANAMLAVRPTGAASPMDVQLRLASVSLITIQQLHDLQETGKLTPRAANDAVWSQAPTRLGA